MAKVIVFGVKDFAELAHYYLTHDSEHEVAGFAVDKEYIPEGGTFCGLPVHPFETIEQEFSPKEFSFFAPLSSRKMNKLRADVFTKVKAKGYNMISYVSSKATRFNNRIGENCFILEDNTLQPFTHIGDNVVLWSGNHIGHHGRIMDHVFFTSHVVMSGHCVIEPYTFVGVNATLRDGIIVKEGTLIAMGAMVTGSTEAWGVYKGSPAKIGEKKSYELDF